ncbi:hypothetical protein CYLTODRAFT_419598 [Cylindrobasidium torrendii FP15055 ss-10]|uniref:Gti1/Pac2 family-domain-containing protein n=1 Tax=Cylindrobasidium torrendii FP15055 ss-10 TaxID=1314674 RepID=A0A0D7BK86_9AGAR|nr:hypothetical protein CYLTODRAFT_419598 [Cylindrobasidium torrendii FP15055 ss-10]
MQRPTCTNLRVRTIADAHAIFHAVSLNLLPIVSRRLDTEERRAIASGYVFVWEERGPNAESSCLGIERWTDSIRWGPSRVKDEFLYYQEKCTESADADCMTSDSDTTGHSPEASAARHVFRDHLIKQTYSVFVETPRGRRKWHLIAYFTQDSLSYLRTIDEMPGIASVYVPPGKYKSARSAKGRPRDSISGCDPFASTKAIHSPPQYSPYPSPAAHAQHAMAVDHVLHKSNAPRGAGAGKLAPLAYLQNIPPPRRHPADEEALNALQGRLVK